MNVQAMVFGNMGNDCATGVAFTRDPSTGRNYFYGEFLVNAQGEDVVAGIRTPQELTIQARQSHGSDLPSLEEVMPNIFRELLSVRSQLEAHYKDMQDIEFTIQQGKLYMLQTRNGKRTAPAALQIAADMANEGLITKEQALLSLKPDLIDQLLHPTLDPKAKKNRAAVENESITSKDKMQATEMLRQYWQDLWHRQSWQEEERMCKAEEIKDILKDHFVAYKVEDGRPSVFEFQHKIKSVKGCAGLDGWRHEELTMIANNQFMSECLWASMGLWESLKMIPTAVNQCKLVHVPKKSKRKLPCGQFRPICVMSAMWRSWSSTWTSSRWVRGWTASIFPPSIAGGMPGAFGPERMAATIGHKVSDWGHGLSQWTSGTPLTRWTYRFFAMSLGVFFQAHAEDGLSCCCNNGALCLGGSYTMVEWRKNL